MVPGATVTCVEAAQTAFMCIVLAAFDMLRESKLVAFTLEPTPEQRGALDAPVPLLPPRFGRGRPHDRCVRWCGTGRRALSCRDAGRVDIRCDAHGKPHFIEVNPLAGLHPQHSDLPIICTLSVLSSASRASPAAFEEGESVSVSIQREPGGGPDAFAGSERWVLDGLEITTGGAKPGDIVFLTKGIPLEGTVYTLMLPMIVK